ncbi:hypothetical protein POTOM_054155 [Populus tomentosa]|uniref:Uncharacterized protein n=1 Tax=Populus tomentosa TaxID=118781 RepID=A0A8X7Y6J4_POPTO|nr:hypothetical protein POTOM_054155 [Populus tomentosa]
MVGSLGVRKGAWTEEEDILLRKCVEKHGEGRWHEVPSRAGLNRCRKSCRMRWLNYLKPNIKRGQFSVDEVDLIIRLHKLLGNRWSLIAGRLSGRTANDVKNYWNSNQRKKVVSSTDAVRSKPEAKSITRDNITKPRPWKFRNLFWLGGKSTPLINVGSQHGNDLCSAAAPAYLESNESHLVENNEPGGIKTGDVFYEQAGQNCWSDISLDADLWNLINTELDQQQPGSGVVGRATWVAPPRLGPSEVIDKPVAWALCDRADNAESGCGGAASLVVVACAKEGI